MYHSPEKQNKNRDIYIKIARRVPHFPFQNVEELMRRRRLALLAGVWTSEFVKKNILQCLSKSIWNNYKIGMSRVN